MSLIERATNIAKSCILPSLTVKIGEQHIDEKNFVDYQPILRNNLQNLLDIFHANQHELLTVDLDTLEFRKCLIIVLCEQSTEYDTIFQISDIFIKETLRNLLQNHVQRLCDDDDRLVQELFEYYHKTLNKDTWKYNLGALNGFLTFSQTLYGTSSTTNFDIAKAQFILATGLNFLDHFEPHIQIIGIKLFNIMLKPSHNSSVTAEHNIDQVILNDVEKLIQKSNEIDFVSELWHCLYACCFLRTEHFMTEQWSKFDDIYEGLLEKLAKENDKDLSLLYLSYINKFSILVESRFNQFNEFLDFNALKDQIVIERSEIKEPKTSKFCLVIQKYRQAPPFVNVRVFRWIKKLLILLQNEAFKIGGNELSVSIHVFELHLFYCFTIFTVPLSILRRNFVEFCTKFIGTLLEIYRLFKHDRFICQVVTEFLITVQVHLSRVGEIDPKIAPLIQRLDLNNDDTEVQKERSGIKTDLEECQKALMVILEKVGE